MLHPGGEPLLPLRLGPWAVAAQCFGLWAFAVAQPLYDLLARSPEFMVAHRMAPSDLLGLTLVLSAAIPGTLVALLLVIWRIHSRAGSLLLALCIWLGVTACVVPLVDRWEPLQGGVGVALAALVSSAVLVSYLRMAAVRSFATWLVVGALLFPVLFVSRAPLGTDAPTPAGASPAPVPANPVPVLVLLLDELPLVSLLNGNDEIDATLYPALAQFASEAHWYRDTVTAGAFTDVAVPAILTGTVAPLGTLATTFRTQPQNLFTLLGESHEIVASEVMTQLCPPELCEAGADGVDSAVLASDLALIYAHIVLPRFLRSRMPGVGDRWTGFGSRDAPRSDSTSGPPRLAPGVARGNQARDEFQEFRSRLVTSAGARPPFYFLHLMLPHGPWRFLPSGRSYVAAHDPSRGMLAQKSTGGRDWGMNQWLVTQAQQRHLMQAAYADNIVGQLLERMKEIGLYDRALIAILADHGIAFLSGEPRRVMGARNLAEILFVPLFIKLPGQRQGVVDDRPASTLDILPTIASLLECQVPWALDGRSLLPGDRSRSSDARFPIPTGRRSVLTRAEFDVLRVVRGERVARKLEVFGDGQGVSGLLRIGEHRALVDRPLSEFQVDESAPDWMAWIARPEGFANYDPTADTIPALVEGRVTGRGSEVPRRALAISVAGRIAAVTETFGKRGSFAAMLPEAALRRGRNQLAVHRIVEQAGNVILAPVHVASRSGGRTGTR